MYIVKGEDVLIFMDDIGRLSLLRDIAKNA